MRRPGLERKSVDLRKTALLLYVLDEAATCHLAAAAASSLLFTCVRFLSSWQHSAHFALSTLSNVYGDIFFPLPSFLLLF